MADHIHTHSAHVRSADKTEYEVRVYGAQQPGGGIWSGWLEFHPIRGGTTVLRTEQETTQPDRAALVYWAGGLEPVYLEGALERARP